MARVFSRADGQDLKLKASDAFEIPNNVYAADAEVLLTVILGAE